MPDRVGQQLGNYRLLRLLGRGGFAEVYLGEHLYLKSQAALKVLHTRLTDEGAQQFVREAQTLARLSHPHIVRILDFAVQEDIPFLVMEYAPGGTLRTRYPRQTHLPLETIVTYVSQVAQALQYAHEHRLIHRDVKPENMLLGSRDDVLLSDFGLAMLAPHTLSASTRPVAEKVVGTSPYLAPEQLRGEAGLASDQYALGVVVYEWLTGTPPFRGSPIEIAMQHLSMPPPSFHQQLPDLPPAIEEVVLRALAKEPALRFASVHAFASALEQASQEVVSPRLTPRSTKETGGEQRVLAAQPLHIQLLGEFRLASGDTPVTSIDKPRLQSLLASLVLHRNAPQSRSHLAYLLWPESTDAVAHSNLRTLVHRLRQALPNADAFLHSDRHGLQWHPSTQEAPWTLDVLDFERALAEAKQAGHSSDLPAERRALEQAVALYRGDLLPSCYDEWILPERDRLRQEFLGGLERLIVVLEQERDYQGAISAAQRLLRIDPLHETTYRHLMRLYAISGNRAAALRTYHTCATVLERELAAEPSHVTREVYEQITQAKEPDRARPAPRPALVAGAPLVGRTQEWRLLQEVWRGAAAGQPQLLVLSGEAGIGKTRLAEELLTWVGRQGNATTSTGCYPMQGGIAYAPVAAWLRSDALRPGLAALSTIWLSEVSRLVPGLLGERGEHADIAPAGPLLEGWQQQRFCEALARAILGMDRPLLLFLDDIQWCDRETLTFLHYLLLFNPQAPLLLVATMRSEEVIPEHPLMALLLTLRRERLVTEQTLEPLDSTRTALLARHVAGRDLPLPVASVLYQETEGNPLFVVETVRAGALEQQREPCPTSPTYNDDDTASAASLLPPTVQAVIAARLAQLSPGARTVVSIAAVIGRSFTFDVLLRASEQDEDALVQGLDEVWQRRIVREQGRDAYDFSHEKLREGAYLTLSSARRRLLHRRVLAALQAVVAPAAQLAYHALRAGLKDLTFHFSVAAGDDAMRLGAIHEAVAYYEQARRALVEYGSIPDQRQSLSLDEVHHLYIQYGRAYELINEHQKARGVYEAMLAFARTENVPTMECAALNHLAMLANWQHLNIERAAALFQEAHQVAERSGDTVGLAETEWGLAQMNYYLVNAKETLLHGKQALALARACGQQELIARSLNVLAYAYELLDQWEEVGTHAEEARAVYTALGNRAMEVDCLCLVAYARVFSGRLQEGVEVARSPYAISKETKNTWGQAYSGVQLTYGLREVGAYSEALEVIRQSMTLAGTLDFPPLLIYCHHETGLVQGTLFALEAACTSLQEATVLNERLKGIPRSRMFSEIIAGVHCMSYALAEEWTRAHEYALQAQEARRDHVPHRWSLTLWYETQALVRAGDIERAEQGVRRFGELVGTGERENKRYRIAYLQSLATLASEQGATEQAIAHLQAAAHLAQEIGLPGEQWLIEAALAELYPKTGDTLQARSALARAAEIVRPLANGIQDKQLRKTFLSAARVQRVLH